MSEQSFGFEKLAKQAAETVYTEFSAWVACAEKHWHGETPIEKLFFAALYGRLKYAEQEYFRGLRHTKNVEAAKTAPFWGEVLIIEDQVQLEFGRVDFLIQHYATWARAPEGGVEGWRKLIVECDGHDFHERTKEQAASDRARDRAAKLSGIDVFRFTGSELWRDPWGCAGQVIEWANRGV